MSLQSIARLFQGRRPPRPSNPHAAPKDCHVCHSRLTAVEIWQARCNTCGHGYEAKPDERARPPAAGVPVQFSPRPVPEAQAQPDAERPESPTAPPPFRPYAELGERLVQLREHRRMTQQTCATASRVPLPFLQAVEAGARRPNQETLRRIAGALRVSYYELSELGGHDS